MSNEIKVKVTDTEGGEHEFSGRYLFGVLEDTPGDDDGVFMLCGEACVEDLAKSLNTLLLGAYAVAERQDAALWLVGEVRRVLVELANLQFGQ